MEIIALIAIAFFVFLIAFKTEVTEEKDPEIEYVPPESTEPNDILKALCSK